MSRILTDKTGLYDLAAVTSIHPHEFVIRQGATPLLRATLNFAGGQVHNTESDFEAVAKQWLAVKQMEGHPSGVPIPMEPRKSGAVPAPIIDPNIPIIGDGM